MVVFKVNPIGLDAVIDKLQRELSAKLIWGNLVTFYPRCYEVAREDRVGVEHYSGSGDYEDVLFAERNKSFFVQVGSIDKENMQDYSTQVDLYFTLDLPIIKPDVTHRADEEVRTDVLMALQKASVPSLVNIREVIIGIRDVYRGFTYNTVDDTQPYHCFKVRLNIQYNPEQQQIC